MPVTRILNLPTWLLARATARAYAILQRTFAEFGLRSLHYRTMAALDEHGALSQAELGRHLELDRKDVTVALALLDDRGLIRREGDPTDGRRKIVTLTRSGRDLLPSLEKALTRAQDEVLAPLSPAERETLRDLLTKLDPAPGDAG